MAQATIPEGQKKTLSLVQSIADKRGLNKYLVLSVLFQEGAKDLKPDRLNKEPKYKDAFPKSRGETAAEHEMKSNAIGLMQVIYGLHRERCGLKRWSDLLDPATNLECGISYLQYCKKKTGNDRDALKCYNGSYKYADAVLARLKEWGRG